MATTGRGQDEPVGDGGAGAGTHRRSDEGVRGRDTAAPAGPLSRRERLAMPRRRGASSGLLLLLLGIWGVLIPFVGPYFKFGFAGGTWHFTTDRLWLDIAPGVVVIVGALLLMGAANRASGGLGAQLALVGGVWFAIGPAFSLLWKAPGPAMPIGTPLGSSSGLHALELLTFFYGLGALIVVLSAFALGRIAVVSVKDVEHARAV